MQKNCFNYSEYSNLCLSGPMFKVLIICIFSLSLDELVEDIPGMVGCMRGLVYNEKGYALSDLIDSRYCLFICL